MSNPRQTRTPFEQFPAEERAVWLQFEIEEMVEAGRFRFERGLGYLNLSERGPCGCPIGCLATATGAVGEAGAVWRHGIFLDLADTGLATVEELVSLEQGYEFGRAGPRWSSPFFVPGASGPFFEVGVRLRARPDAAPTWGPKLNYPREG